MKKLLIYTFGVGRYAIYTDLFQFVCSKSYPEYRNIVFKITPNNPEDHGWPQYYGACIRYLYEPPEMGYEFYYITDIDMMILRESPSLLDFHCNEMAETGLCYSNTPRGRETQGPNRLTGLHFCNGTWFEKTREAREDYIRKLRVGMIGRGPIDDELMLMQLVYKSGLPPPPPHKDLIIRHHGIHLGTLRAYRRDTLQTRRWHVYKRVNQDKARQWQEIVETVEYKKISTEIAKRDKDAAWELQELDKFTKQLSK